MDTNINTIIGRLESLESKLEVDTITIDDARTELEYIMVDIGELGEDIDDTIFDDYISNIEAIVER